MKNRLKEILEEVAIRTELDEKDDYLCSINFLFTGPRNVEDSPASEFRSRVFKNPEEVVALCDSFDCEEIFPLEVTNEKLVILMMGCGDSEIGGYKTEFNLVDNKLNISSKTSLTEDEMDEIESYEPGNIFINELKAV